MGTVTTAVKMIYSNKGKGRETIVIHMDSTSSGILRLSQTDQTVTQDYEELDAGDTIALEDFEGSVWALASTGTITYHIPFIGKGTGFLKA